MLLAYEDLMKMKIWFSVAMETMLCRMRVQECGMHVLPAVGRCAV